MNKKVILIGLGVVVAVAGFLFFTEPAPTEEGTPSSHTYGQSSLGITLTEYGDFQCPGCGAYHPVIKEVKELYKDRVTFQFRHLPLEEIHKNARAAARAAEAAHMQDKFWEMHDMLFENQQAWQETSDPVNLFTSYAQQLGLDTNKFAEDYKSAEVNATINADLNEFKNTGEPKSTPTFFLNGEKIEPVNSIEGFSDLLDEAIAEADSSGEDQADTTSEEPATAPEEEATGDQTAQ